MVNRRDFERKMESNFNT